MKPGKQLTETERNALVAQWSGNKVNVQLFRTLETSAIESILLEPELRIFTVGAGESVFEQGHATDSKGMYLVLSGLIAIKHKRHDGKNLIVALDSAGTCIGDVEYLLRGILVPFNYRGEAEESFQASAVAMMKSTLLYFDAGALKRMFENPAILLNLAQMFSVKLLRRSSRSDLLRMHQGKDHDRLSVFMSLVWRLANDPSVGTKPISSDETDSDLPETVIKHFVELNVRLRRSSWAEIVGAGNSDIEYRQMYTDKTGHFAGKLYYHGPVEKSNKDDPQKGRIFVSDKFKSSPAPRGTF